MSVSSINNLPKDVLSNIVVAIEDPVLFSQVCKMWAEVVREDPLLYVKIFDEWMKNKNIAPLLIYLPEYVPQPDNTDATRLVKLAYGQILAQVKEYMVNTRKKHFPPSIPILKTYKL